MLKLRVLGVEMFDEESETFEYTEGIDLQLEHSLASLSKWESIHEKPFLGKNAKSNDEVLSYIHSMILTPDVPDDVVSKFSEENFEAVNRYIDAKMTATWFNEVDPPKSTETITSELIYYWMTMFNIPMECEYWHLNRLFTLIKIANLKNAKPKKMSRSELAARNRKLNEERKAQLGSKG